MSVLDGEPWAWLTAWLPPNDEPLRPLMTLSTVTAEGAPDARGVLLTEFAPDGFYFHTDAGSRKAAQLAANPAVALTVQWPDRLRQLVASGTASPAPAAEVAAAYRGRPPYLRQLAWQNTPEFARLPDDDRRMLWREFAGTHPVDELEPPPSWAGFRVAPRRLTFWQGDPDTASRRTEFTLHPDGWRVSLLPG